MGVAELGFGELAGGDVDINADEADGRAAGGLGVEVDPAVGRDPVDRAIGPNDAELAVVDSVLGTGQSPLDGLIGGEAVVGVNLVDGIVVVDAGALGDAEHVAGSVGPKRLRRW